MIILDTGAALALAHGHEALHRLADKVAHTPGDGVHVPALCLLKAEESDEKAGSALLALPGLQVDALGQVAAVAVGGMVRDGWGGADVCHALYVATPHLESGGMSIILTDREDAYPPGFLAVDINSPAMLGYT
ncbi:hypothetical protein [Streptomyces sp. CRN 30]|uniref:hypothetical protein n=1 Tax=Streptomyces sp. CRN 30 TaxID=3075613 RepID=UPI002A80C4F0|nr:hypothetical protein [Streptomyces sp. CRN 30]